MNRRSFLKWFGAATAVAVVAPQALPKIAEAMAPSVEAPLASVGLVAYDLPYPLMIYPVLTPFRNAIPRAYSYDAALSRHREMYAKMMLHEDRTIMFGKEKAEALRLRDELAEAGDNTGRLIGWVNERIQEVASIAS